MTVLSQWGRYPINRSTSLTMIHSITGIKAQIDDCSVTMGKIPDKPFNFSDHEGVEAHVTLTKTDGMLQLF